MCYLLKAAICCFTVKYQMSFGALILPTYLSVAASAGDWGQRDPGVRPAHCCPPQRWQRPCAVPAECQQQRGESWGACGRHRQQHEKVSVTANLPQLNCHRQQHEKVSVTANLPQLNCHSQQHEKVSVTANLPQLNCHSQQHEKVSVKYHLANLPQHNCHSQQHEKVSRQICHNTTVIASNMKKSVSRSVVWKVTIGKFATTQLS